MPEELLSEWMRVNIQLPSVEIDRYSNMIGNSTERMEAFERHKQAIRWCEKRWGEPSFVSRWTFKYHTDIRGSAYHTFYFKNKDDKIIFQLTWL